MAARVGVWGVGGDFHISTDDAPLGMRADQCHAQRQEVVLKVQTRLSSKEMERIKRTFKFRKSLDAGTFFHVCIFPFC